jgi:hypothetical protein
MSEDRILPPPPSSAPRLSSREADFWAGLFLDLSVRVEWLAQALDAVPREDASAPALVRLRSYARALQELHQAIEHVHAHRADLRLKPLFALDGPLAAYLSRLYAWSEEIGDDFERMAAALRRRSPTSVVFSHQAVSGSYAHFDGLVAAMRRAIEVPREPHDVEGHRAWRALDESLEELVWAAEWVHMTLARRPGD